MDEKKEVKKAPEVKKVEKEVTYIMKVTHLSWGQNGKNHFFAEKKPLISKTAMGKFASILDVWLENEWIQVGSYK
jgi:hypothetical protein